MWFCQVQSAYLFTSLEKIDLICPALIFLAVYYKRCNNFHTDSNWGGDVESKKSVKMHK